MQDIRLGIVERGVGVKLENPMLSRDFEILPLTFRLPLFNPFVG